MPKETSDRYTIISADTHAGGSHREYREYLDPEWRDEFDAWREQYRNPWKDLRDTDLRTRNWDDERRDAAEADTGDHAPGQRFESRPHQVVERLGDGKRPKRVDVRAVKARELQREERVST